MEQIRGFLLTLSVSDRKRLASDIGCHPTHLKAISLGLRDSGLATSKAIYEHPLSGRKLSKKKILEELWDRY